MELVRLGNGDFAINVVTTGRRPASASSSSSSVASRVERAAADVEDGPLRRGDRMRRVRDLARMAVARRLPAGQVDLVRVDEVELGLLDVAWDVDEDRAAAAGAARRGTPP